MDNLFHINKSQKSEKHGKNTCFINTVARLQQDAERPERALGFCPFQAAKQLEQRIKERPS